MTIPLYELLPAIIRARDEEASGSATTDPLLKRVVGTVQDEVDDYIQIVEEMRNLIRPSLTSALILSLLAKYLGFTEFPFSEVASNPREYVASEVDGHKIKGTFLGLLREMNARNIASGHYIQELWKTTVNAVDEYVPTQADGPYDSIYPAARIVFIEDPYDEGPPAGGPAPSDGSTTGIFVENQAPYSVAKQFRQQLNNVFPIQVIVPTPTERIAFNDTYNVPTDSLEGTIYVLLNDFYAVTQDQLEVITQCVSNCQVSCQERCETLCELTCETTCEQACQALCESDCQAICQTFCQGSCETGCQDPCQNFCQSSCEGQCQSACEVQCQQQCQFGCQTAGESCQSFCENNCQTDAEVLCDDSCQMTCQSDAQNPCDSGPPAGEGG